MNAAGASSQDILSALYPSAARPRTAPWIEAPNVDVRPASALDLPYSLRAGGNERPHAPLRVSQ